MKIPSSWQLAVSLPKLHAASHFGTEPGERPSVARQLISIYSALVLHANQASIAAARSPISGPVPE